MTITNGYTDWATLKAYLGIGAGVTTNDNEIDMAINGASRAIDQYCNRKFWLDPTPVAHTFIPNGLLYLAFGSDDELGGDIGTTAGLVVQTDPSGNGTFGVTWASTDYQLLPQNAAAAWPEPRPWTAMRAIGTKTFPWLVNTWLTRLDRVKITAQWGWPAVPDAVTQACLIKAARLYHRKDSPQGVAGFGEFGPVRLSKTEDGDVVQLLATYGRGRVLVA